MLVTICKLLTLNRVTSFNSVLPRPRFCDILAKKSKCRIQNRLGAPFIAFEFAW